MKIVSWNIRGCNNPRKWKTLPRKINQEISDIIFLEETKCNTEGMEIIRDKIWKGGSIMALDVDGMAWGITVLWQPNVVDLEEWWDNQFSLMADFQLLDIGVKGSLMNVYGAMDNLKDL